jgi:DNA-binding NtrC family response regulator
MNTLVPPCTDIAAESSIPVLVLGAAAHAEASMVSILSRHGCEVLTAKTVQEAMSLTADRRVRVVVAAIDPYDPEWQARLQACKSIEHANVVVILPRGDGELVAEALKNGATDAIGASSEDEVVMRAVRVAYTRSVRAEQERRARERNPGFRRTSSHPLRNSTADEPESAGASRRH